MKYKTLSLIICLLTTLGLIGCANKPAVIKQADIAPVTQPDMQYLVSRGERLAGISYLLTGSQDNWPVIAKHNNIDNPRNLKVGAVLTIPGYLLTPAEQAAPVLPAKTQTARLEKPILKKPVKARRVKNGKIIVYQPTAVPGPKTVKVKTRPVNVNREFNRASAKAADRVARQAEPTNLAPDNRSEWVLVVGSYYPKGIYQQPDVASRIILRVAPGSRLRLGGKMREWLQVETDKGVGYIRATDAEILAERPAAAKLLAGL